MLHQVCFCDKPSTPANKHKTKVAPILLAYVQTGLKEPDLNIQGAFKHGGKLQYHHMHVCKESMSAIQHNEHLGYCYRHDNHKSDG